MPFEATISGATKAPVDGVNVSLVLVTFNPDTEPVVALVNVGYRAVAVEVSLVIVTPEVTVEAIEIEPEPLVILIPVPADNVVLVKPVPLPISSWPLVGVAVNPVPPEATGNADDNVTTPALEILNAFVAPLLPTFKLIASVAPTPEVDCNVSDDPVPVPPKTNGLVIDVVNVGVVAKATTVPEPVVV